MSNSNTSLIAFIQSIYPMPQQQAQAIAQRFNEKAFCKDDFLLKEGKICNEYHFLEAGYMRVYAYDTKGNDITTAFCFPNGVVFELFSFFKRVPSKENIQALTDCKSWYLSFDELQDVFHSMQQFREFGRTVLVNAYAGLKQRMLSMIQETAEERYVSLIKSNPDIFQYAPLKNIASYLGVTDTSLSRIRKEYSKK